MLLGEGILPYLRASQCTMVGFLEPSPVVGTGPGVIILVAH